MLLGVVALATVLVLSGCAVIVFESSNQLDVIGKARINTGVCLGGFFACPDSNTGNSEPTGDMQFLVGYRIPTKSEAPATWTGTSEGGETITFSRSDSYTSELQRLSPAPDGQQWVGYVSSVHHHVGASSLNSDKETFSFLTDFGLVQGSDGSPYEGPFQYRTVVGRRTVDPAGTPAQPADRPVKCGDTLTSKNSVDGPAEGGTICADSPSSKTIATNRSQPTRDLGVFCQGANQVQAGKDGAVNFNLKYAGAAGPEATFDLRATTTAPGATVTPSQDTLAPASDSTTGVGTTVKVPGTTAPGTYDVTLTASVGGQRRSNHCALTVVAPPTATIGILGVRSVCATRPFTVRVNATRVGVTSVRVLLDGRQLASSAQARFDVRIDPRLLRAGRHTIRTIVTDAAGRTTQRTTSFRACAAATPRPKAPARRLPTFTG
jgi:hypothetical protein